MVFVHVGEGNTVQPAHSLARQSLPQGGGIGTRIDQHRSAAITNQHRVSLTHIHQDH